MEKLKIFWRRHRKLSVFLLAVFLFVIFISLFSYRKTPKSIEYGVTFTKMQAEALGLDSKETYLAVLDDLKVRRLRLVAHWPMVEPEKDRYSFSELDFQIDEAEKRGAKVILSVGRRLPRWPECHIPSWASDLSWEDQKSEIREYIEAVVLRYKDREAVIYWQVENEPFLKLFAYEYCGDLDEDFLKEEVAIVRNLDPNTPVMLTDSGNLGLWLKPYKLADAFGTSLYRYFWTPEAGVFKSRLPAAFYRAKYNFSRILYGKKPAVIIELSAEPWLIKPISEVSVDVQLDRMSMEKFKETLEFAPKTGFDTQYLWGVEWWYRLKKGGNSEFWEYAKSIISVNY